MKWFFQLSLLVRIPLLTAIMIFLVAMIVTQMTVLSLSRQYELQTERIGQVYLDGLTAAVENAYENKDLDAIHLALTQSLSFYLGVVDRQLALIDRQAGILAHVSGPNLTSPTPPPDDILHTPKGYVYESDARSIWVWRQLGTDGVLAANLDTSAFAQERAALRWRVLLLGALLSLISALAGYLVIRRLQRPLSTLSNHLSHAVAFGPQKIDDKDIIESDEEAHALMIAYNEMVDASQDRERLLERLIRQDQQALLGRISATLAHEIRNPLTGIMTALQTIRMYGADATIRHEALEFIDRGIQSLQGVAQATLNTYRPRSSGPALELTDLHDIILLVEPHASRNNVNLVSDLQLAKPISLDAFKIRQIALNLLLNAIQTSPDRGSVTFSSSSDGDIFKIIVTDEGPGLPVHARNFLLNDETIQNYWSLGLETVRRLTQEMGGHITVHSDGHAGSAIELSFSLKQETRHEKTNH